MLVPPPSKYRLINLDVLRIFAAISVALFHYTVQYTKFSGRDNPFGFSWGAGTIDLFFMISGFVILLSCCHGVSSVLFLKKRFRAIYPPFLVACSLSFILLYVSPMIKSDAVFFHYLSNISLIALFTSAPLIDGAYWTLSYEVGFYCFMALSFQRFFRKNITWLPTYLYIGSFIYFLIPDYIPSPSHLFLMVNDHAHLFGYGMIIYLWKHEGFRPYYILYGAMTILLHYFHHDYNMDAAILVGCFVILFPVIIFKSLPKNKLVLWLSSLGAYSYLFYLLHQMIGFTLIYHLQNWGMPSSLLLLMVFLLIFALSFCIRNLLIKFNFS